jgi:Tfp pilus assembly protein PilX
MILFTALLILSLLITVGVGARVMLQSDYKISSNLRLSKDAFYLAEAGIEWSKHDISTTTSHPPTLGSASQNFSSGTFSVSFLSTTAVTPLDAKVVVRSVGAIGTSSQTLQAQVTKSYDLADGAVGLRGNAGGVAFAGSSFLISGMDNDPATATVIPGSKPRSAITVSDDTLRGLVEAGLNASQRANITGSGGGTAAAVQSGFLPGAAVTQLANGLCNSAYAQTTSVPAGGALTFENQTWGTQASPQLRCIDGLVGPGDSVSLGGSISGTGILVVRDADLVLSGSFRWEGLVIVTGSNVSFKVSGSDSKEIYGSLMVNETGSPGSGTAILDIQGSAKLLFSRPALNRIVSLIPSATLDNIYSSLPSTITQDYWRTVSPN